MPFALPSLSETRTFLMAVGRAVLPGRNWASLRSYYARKATYLSAAMTQLTYQILQIALDVMVDTAGDGEPINRWGRIYKIIRRGATASFGTAAARVKGTATTAVTIGQELVHEPSGLRFRFASGGVIPSAGYLDVDIESVSRGSGTKLLKGAVLKILSTPVGLSSIVTLVADLTGGGFDNEPFGSYRSRLLDRIGTPGAGGNDADWRQWMFELSFVYGVFVYATRAGGNTVDLVGLRFGVGVDRILSAGQITELMTYVKTKCPKTLAAPGGGLRHLAVQPTEQGVEIAITPDGQAAHAFDWTGGPMTITAYAAREITVSGVLPASLKAGARLSLEGVATEQDGREMKIEALTGASSFLLELAPDVDPDNTDKVHAGGPLVTPIRDAIMAHMNGVRVYAGRGRVPLAETAMTSTVGFEIIAEGIGPANPIDVVSPEGFGPWSGALVRSVIEQIAQYKAGVRKANVIEPVADVEAEDDEFPNDAEIHMLVPSFVLVRSA